MHIHCVYNMKTSLTHWELNQPFLTCMEEYWPFSLWPELNGLDCYLSNSSGLSSEDRKLACLSFGKSKGHWLLFLPVKSSFPVICILVSLYPDLSLFTARQLDYIIIFSALAHCVFPHWKGRVHMSYRTYNENVSSNFTALSEVA